MGFQLALTHWSALYIAWFFPFVVLAVLAGTELGGVVPERSRFRFEARRPRMDTGEGQALPRYNSR
jgi:hypothetical protein